MPRMFIQDQPSSKIPRWVLITLSLVVPFCFLSAILMFVQSAEAEPLAPAAEVFGVVVAPDGSTITDTAWVCLKPEAPEEAWSDWEVCTGTTTSGVFTIMRDIPGELLPGTFLVEAYAPHDMPYFKSIPQPVAINDNASMVDVGLVRLTYASFAGMVYKPDGTMPADQGWVSVYETSGDDWFEVAGGNYYTGAYAVGGVPGGNFHMIAYPPRDSLLWESVPESVTVNVSSQYNPDATQPYSLYLQAPNIVGHVVYPDGNPVTWVMSDTEVLGDAWGRAINMDWSVDVERPSDSGGEFGLRVPPGDYAIWAEPQGTLAMTYTKAVPREMYVGPGSLWFPIFEPFTLTYPSFVGRIYDPAGRVVTECMTVWLMDMHDREVAWDWTCDGAFKLGGVPAGDYRLDTEGLPQFGLFPPEPHPVRVDPGTQYDSGFVPPNMPITLTAPQLEVLVEHPLGTGRPAHVWLWDDEGFEAIVDSAPDGPALFGGLKPGDYWVQAWPMEHDIPMLANSTQKLVTIREGHLASLTLLLRAPNVTGTVETPEGDPLPPAFDEGGNPVPHPVEIEVHNTDWTFALWAMTNMTGEFSLALPHDDYELLARPMHSFANLYTKSPLVHFTAPGPGDPPLNLDYIQLTYPRVLGWVLDPFGRRMATSVNVWRDDGNYYDWDDTHPPEKPFRLGGMPDGRYHVQADPPWDNPEGYGSSNIVSFDVPPTATEQITLYLDMANFVGELRLPGDFNECPECPVPGVEVRVRDEAWTWEHWTGTGVDGRFAFSGLMTDTLYFLKFFLPPELQMDWVEPRPPIMFTFSSLTEQVTGTYHLRPAVRSKRIVGQVRNQEGVPMDDAVVYAKHEDSARFAETHVDATGHYTLNVVGGLWRVGTHPDAPGADWWFDPAWEQWVWFSHTVELEEQVVSLTVIQEDFFQVTGIITTPDGSDIPPETVGIDLCTNEGDCFGVPAKPNGAFAFHAPAGIYERWVWVDPATGWLPPLHNGKLVEIAGDKSLGTFHLREQGDRTARVMGRVVITPSGLGLEGVPLEAWTDSGDWNATETITRGQYTLNLLPGFWHGGPKLTPDQEERYVVLPPRLKNGYVGAGEIISNVNFILRRRDATIRGTVIDEASAIITDVEAVVFAELCRPNILDPTAPPHCWIVDDDLARDGRFRLKVPGGVTYTLGIWPISEGYMPGPPVETHVGVGQTAATSLVLLEANAHIYGCLIAPGEPGCVQDAYARIFAIGPNGKHQVEDYIWPNKVPPTYGMWVREGVTWTLDFDVDPASGYVVDPAYKPEKLTLAYGEVVSRSLPILPLQAVITGHVGVKIGNVISPAPHIWVFAAGNVTGTQGLYFETKTDASGTFTMPVLPGGYGVGAYLPPQLAGQFFPPPVQTWASEADNPVNMLFRHRPMGEEAVEVIGNLTVSPTASLPTGTPVHVFGWSEDGSTAEVTGTLGTGYRMPIVSGTVWHVWAAYEDTENNRFFASQEEVVNVGNAEVTGVDLQLEWSPFELPDGGCWTFDPSQNKRLVLPARSDLFAPLVDIPAGAMPVTDTVEVCATPIVALPSGHNLIGFAYEMDAYDSQGNLITYNFDKSVRLIFYFNEAALGNADPEDLQLVYYSTVRQEWVALDDMYVDADDMFATGQIDHFTKMGVMSPPAESGPALTEDNYIYLPLVLRNS